MEVASDCLLFRGYLPGSFYRSVVGLDAGAHRRRDPGSGCSDSKADRVSGRVQTVQKPAPAWEHTLLYGNRDTFRLRQDRNGDAASQFHIGSLLSQICGRKELLLRFGRECEECWAKKPFLPPRL